MAIMDVVIQSEACKTVPFMLDYRGRKTRSRETHHRLAAIAQGLRTNSGCVMVPADYPASTLERAIRSVHGQGYLKSLSHWSHHLKRGQAVIDHPFHAPGIQPDTPAFAGCFSQAKAAVQTALSAADRLIKGGTFAFALCRPPGHHAGPSWMGGYCYLNNGVIAARYLAEKTHAPVAIIDTDFHFGNGTAALTKNRGDFFFGSVHCDPKLVFPFMDAVTPGENQNFRFFQNTPSPTQFLGTVELLLQGAVDWGCETLVVSLGFDIIKGDPHGGWDLVPSLFDPLGRLLASAGLPLCLVLEGGYLIKDLRSCAHHLARGILQGECTFLPTKFPTCGPSALGGSLQWNPFVS